VKPRIDDVAAWNERWAREYDIDRYYAASSWLVRTVEARRLAATVQLLGPPPGALVVELGCGAGHVLANFPGDVLGIDIAPTMLAKARRRLGSRALLVRADVERVPLRDASLRWLVCTEVIEHVIDPAQLLAEIARLLAPGGRVVVTFPNETMIEAIKRSLLWLGLFRVLLPSPTTAVEADWHLHRFSRTLFESLRPASLRLLEQRAIPSRLAPLRWACLLEREV
jgi:ubiquinone/menaquinone biosynthesis C-methylase UbiE